MPKLPNGLPDETIWDRKAIRRGRSRRTSTPALIAMCSVTGAAALVAMSLSSIQSKQVPGTTLAAYETEILFDMGLDQTAVGALGR